jgi:gamma-glutamylcyclotransferase (GGCT)/AIG2-like uncharacterized protein YtfP
MAALLGAASTHVGQGFFQGRLYRVSWYPGAVASDSPRDQVTGDVFKIHAGQADSLFRTLDDYEGARPEGEHPALYRRERVRVHSEDGGEIEAWIYLFNHATDRLERIGSGDFLEG